MFPYDLFSNESVQLQQTNKIKSIQRHVLNEERHAYFIASQLVMVCLVGDYGEKVQYIVLHFELMKS
jgi:hypothetical protein